MARGMSSPKSRRELLRAHLVFAVGTFLPLVLAAAAHLVRRTPWTVATLVGAVAGLALASVTLKLRTNRAWWT